MFDWLALGFSLNGDHHLLLDGSAPNFGLCQVYRSMLQQNATAQTPLPLYENCVIYDNRTRNTCPSWHGEFRLFEIRNSYPATACLCDFYEGALLVHAEYGAMQHLISGIIIMLRSHYARYV